MTISSALIKELREKTNAGMMDCKKALEETKGDFQAAIEWLRKKGLASAAKKADRLASEGLVLAVKEGNSTTMLEVNSETDFVAKNEIFKSFVEKLGHSLNRSNLTNQVDQALTLPFMNGLSVEMALKETIAKIGENIVFRRFVKWQTPHLVETYTHGDGKIGVMVELETNQPNQQDILTLAKDLCLHIAAMNPIALSSSEVPHDLLEKEKEILRAKNLEQGKKAEMIDKIVEGQIRKFLSESCLLEQAFVKNPDVKVSNHIQEIAKKTNASIKLLRYLRFELGEGLEKKANNFAQEVAAQAKIH